MEGYRCYRIEYGYECSCPEGRIWLPRTIDADCIEDILNAFVKHAEPDVVDFPVTEAMVSKYQGELLPELIEEAWQKLRKRLDEEPTTMTVSELAELGRILKRKQAGQDCTEHESALVKRYFDRDTTSSFALRLAEAFPIEAAEWESEKARGDRR